MWNANRLGTESIFTCPEYAQLRLLETRPQLSHLMVHNIDTVGADADPAVLGYHIAQGAALTTEVIARHLEDPRRWPRAR